jgi:hypothetical protein
MDDQGATRGANPDPEQWLDQAPKVADALKRGVSVSVTTWGGRELAGTICDREPSGLLVDVREPGVQAEGYVFLPWSSVEQVVIRGVAQRRGKFLPG